MAEFYKGFAFECDVKGRLTIEGNQVQIDGNPVQVVTAPLDGGGPAPVFTADDKTVASARAYIDSSPELRAREHPEVHPMLAAHDFTEHDAGVVLDGYDFSYTNFTQASLLGMSLKGANFHQAILAKANLTCARLEESNFCRTDFYETNFEGAWLTGANLQGVQLTKTILKGAHLTGCHVYGLAAWGLVGEPRDQSNLVITLDDEPNILVDNLEVAQFIYLLVRNDRIRDVIDTLTAKVVLILGHFSQDRKPVLEAIREQLRQRNLVPVLFDFERPASKDLTGTVETLARLARFIIADITDPRSVPHELATVVPFLRTTPVIPLRLAGSQGYGMFDDLRRSYRWVSEPYVYQSTESLVSALPDIVGAADVRFAALQVPQPGDP